MPRRAKGLTAALVAKVTRGLAMNVTSRSLLKPRLLLSIASVTFAALSTPAPAHVVFSPIYS